MLWQMQGRTASEKVIRDLPGFLLVGLTPPEGDDVGGAGAESCVLLLLKNPISRLLPDLPAGTPFLIWTPCISAVSVVPAAGLLRKRLTAITLRVGIGLSDFRMESRRFSMGGVVE